jgi:hypothetical protein
MNNTNKNIQKELLNQNNIKNNIELKSNVNIDCGEMSSTELKKRFEDTKNLCIFNNVK